MANKLHKYQLINYFDVWGNTKDGWEVNNSCVEFDDLHITDDASDKEILTYLRDIGFLVTNDMRKVKIDNDGEIYQVKGYRPIGRLQIIN